MTAEQLPSHPGLAPDDWEFYRSVAECPRDATRHAPEPAGGLLVLHVGEEVQIVAGLVDSLEALAAVIRILMSNSVPAAVQEGLQLRELRIRVGGARLQLLAELEGLLQATRIFRGEQRARIGRR